MGVRIDVRIRSYILCNHQFAADSEVNERSTKTNFQKQINNKNVNVFISL